MGALLARAASAKLRAAIAREPPSNIERVAMAHDALKLRPPDRARLPRRQRRGRLRRLQVPASAALRERIVRELRALVRA